MAFCKFCKAEGQKTGQCAYCGTGIVTGSATFIYGASEKDSYACEFQVTNKYLILRGVSKAEMAGNVTAGAAFGLIGAAVATATDAARQKTYAFYDLQDLQKVVHPYHTARLKKDTAFRFVNKDGTDFVLNFDLNGLFSGKSAKTFATCFAQTGVPMTADTVAVNPCCCHHPYLTAQTFAVRVCASAVPFVRLDAKHQPVPPMGAAVQPVQAPVQPVQAPVQPVERVVCPRCGRETERKNFCMLCGQPLTQPDAPTTVASDWLNKW